MYGFFDKFLKGEQNGRLDEAAEGDATSRWASNKWQTSDTWPPAGAQPMTFYLSSGGKANTLNGDGALAAAAPDADTPDCVHLRSDESGAVVRRQRLLHRQRDHGRLVRSAQDGSA